MTVFRDYSQGSFNSVKHSWNFAGSKVRKLSRRKGGSIVGLAGKSTVPDVPTLVVSLGGLGGETLNEVKRKFNRTAAPQIHGNETVMFAEVDTCQIELNHLEEDIYDENSIGFMRDWEQLQIVYDCTVGAAGFVGIAINDETIPQHEWVDKNLPLGNGTQIDNSGAHARRQVGRLALSIKANYVHLLAMIEKKLKILCNYACVVDGFRQVNVMLVAGISGGTGGGCIIDFTYLLRLAAKRIGGVSLNINAILYTSDVQENLLPYLNPYFLKCNFIASMKEVDYFFKAGFTGEKYTFKSGMFPDGIVKTPDGSRVGDGESLFDSIILIQGFGSDGRILDKEVAINTVSDYIVNNLCCIELMDEINNLNEHGAANAIIPNIIQHNMRLPRDVHYSYRTIGYKSVEFPVEEIMTVVVAHVLDALHQKYQKNPSISGMDVLTNVIGIYPLSEKCFEMGQKNQRTIRAIRDSTLGYTNVREIKAFDMGQIYYPVDRYSYDDTWTENVYDYIVYIIKEELYRNGPYAALRLSQDICDCLERDLAGDKRSYDKAYLIDQTNRYRQNIENAKNSIETAGIVGLVRQIGAVFGDNSVQKQIDEFVNNLRNYDVARWKLAYYGDCMNAVEKLYQRLLKQHDEVFGRYVGAFLSVAETVKRDATEIVNSDYVDDKFCSYLLNPGDLSNDNSRLYDLIRYCIKPEDIEDLSKKFTKSMLENEKKWTSMSDNEFDGVEQFKKVFDFYFGEFKKNIVQLFMVIKHTDGVNIPIDTIFEQLEHYMANPSMYPNPWFELENFCNINYGVRPLHEAAEEILEKVLSVKYSALEEDSISAMINFSDFPQRKCLCLMKDIPDINEIIRTLPNYMVWMHNGGLVFETNIFSVFCLNVVYALPLYMFKGFVSSQIIYYRTLNSELSMAAGMHIDASPKRPWKDFPQIVNSDAIRLIEGSHTKAMLREDYKYEIDLLNDIKEQAEYCISEENEMVVLKHPEDSYYTLYYIDSAYNRVDWYRELIENFEDDIDKAISSITNINVDDVENDWNNKFEDNFTKKSLRTRLFEVNCILDEVQLHDISCFLGSYEKDRGNFEDVDDSGKGGLYKVIRHSTEFRLLLRDVFKICHDLNNELEKTLNKRVEEIRKAKVEEIKKQLSK